MPIVGVTDRGVDFPELGRIRKGTMKKSENTGNMYPVDLDYFRVDFAEGEEKAAKKFWAHYPDQPKEINIFLPFNEIDRMWDANLEAYTASRMIASSDGEFVQYKCDGKTGEVIVRNGINIKTGKPEPHPENDVAGYDYNDKPITYSPRGRLKVIVPEIQEAGYLLVLTGSWADCENISKQLRGIKELNNGVIKGIPLILRRRDDQVMAPIDGKRQRVTKSLLSVKAHPDWIEARINEDQNRAFPEHIARTMLEPELRSDHVSRPPEKPPAELLPRGQGNGTEEDEIISDGEFTPADDTPEEVVNDDPYKEIKTADGVPLNALDTDKLVEYLNNVLEYSEREDITDSQRVVAERRSKAAKHYLNQREG